jgi:HlyD family secretion protein
MEKFVKIIIVFIVGLATLFLTSSCKRQKTTTKVVKVQRGDIVDKAVALGTIEAKNEIGVKSRFSGIVKYFFIDVGDKVKRGAPLLEIDPTPTPIELAEARKGVEIAAIEFKNIKQDIERKRVLKEKGLISDKDYETTKRDFEKAKSNLVLAQERLDIMGKGNKRRDIKTIIRSPVSGTILERLVNQGDPVVPLTSYQPGTELLSIANIDSLIFKGTVDEIDVGRLKEGMKAELTVGALPQDKTEGEITKIAPKARRRENATVFDIEIKITKRGEKPLRVGYSATADIIINKRENVLLIPEGAVHFEGDRKYVHLQNKKKREIEIGLSDGLNVEIISGLKEGEEIRMK